MPSYPGNDIPMGTDRVTGESVTLTRSDRARHTYIAGSTRVGKSKLVEHMCREDLVQWPNYRCPMVVLDPHGTLYKNLMAFVAAEGLDEWPIVPVDLSRGDLVVSYNLLRRREDLDPSVVCRSFVDAILYAWGQANTNQTARLATWLHTLLMLAYEREHTLTEALQIIANPELRRLIAAEVQDLVVRSVIQSAEQLKEREFQDRVESTLYRINRFLSGQILRATFCQTGESLDMGRVLKEGQILLANLSIEGSHIHTEDASAFGAVLLADLWTAAYRRGKREEGELSPCYVYVDEFQNFVGPTIAKGLAEASGFGIHLHLICQWPSQIIDHGGEVGRLVLNSVLNNAQNKILFKLEHPDDLDMMTRILFRQAVDPNKVKDEIIAPTVVGYDLQYYKSYNRSTSRGTSRSVTESHGYSTGYSVSHSQSDSTGVSLSHGVTDGTSQSHTSGVSDTEGISETEDTTVGHMIGQSQSRGTTDARGESEQWSAGESSGTSRTNGSSDSSSETHSFNRPREEFQEELDEYASGSLDAEEEDAFKRKWSTAMSLTEGASSNTAESVSQSASRSRGGGASRSTAESREYGTSVSRNDSLSHSEGRTRTHGRSMSSQNGHSRSVTDNLGVSFSHQEGMSETVSEQESHSVAESYGESESETQGEGLAPMLMPVMEERVSSRQFKSVEEQLFEMSKLIDAQRVRHCFLRLASAAVPIPIVTPVIEAPQTTPEYARERTTALIKKLPFVLPFAQADQNVRDRQAKLIGRLYVEQSAREPVATRRLLKARVVPPEDKKTQGEKS